MPHSEGYKWSDAKNEYLRLTVGCIELVNPIEHLWDSLGRVVDEMHPMSLPDLKDKIFSSWESIAPEVTKKIVDSMPTHVYMKS